MAPAESQPITFRTPALRRMSVTATPAAPTPVITTLISSILLPTTLRALSSAASTTIAVPCWSSWKTGMSSSARNRSSISKQRGAEMSSRLMPPKPGAIAFTIGDDLVGVLRVETDRPGVDAAELLEEQRLALHHGHRRLRADVAEAEDGGSVGDDGDGVLLDRQVPGRVGVGVDRHGRPVPPRACRPSRGRRASSREPSSASRSCRRGA